MRVDEGWGRLMIRKVRVVWVQWVLLSVLLEVGGWCILSSHIWCSTAVIPSFFQLGIFLLTLWCVCLARASLCRSNCLGIRAAFIASVQYCWVSRWVAVSSVKLTSRRNWHLSGTSLGLRSESLVISCKRSSDCLLGRYP
jgi:hypothetical protein